MRLILNGKSAASPEVRDAVQKLRGQGREIEVRVTWEGGDAERFAHEARLDGVDRLIAGGGDGTINEVVNGLFRDGPLPQTALAVMPLGTANDFAAGCSIPMEPYPALTLAAEGRPVLIDVGRANERFFINVASGGFGAEVTANTPAQLKKALGGGAYSLVGILTAVRMEPYPCRLIGPDDEMEAQALFVAVGNGRQVGGGLEVTPNAFLDDGLLDVLLIEDVPWLDLGVLLDELNDFDAPNNRFVHYRQMPFLQIETGDERPLNLDGEPTRVHGIRFDLASQSLPMILPEDTTMLKKGFREKNR